MMATVTIASRQNKSYIIGYNKDGEAEPEDKARTAAVSGFRGRVTIMSI